MHVVFHHYFMFIVLKPCIILCMYMYGYKYYSIIKKKILVDVHVQQCMCQVELGTPKNWGTPPPPPSPILRRIGDPCVEMGTLINYTPVKDCMGRSPSCIYATNARSTA